jgi:hypothetical protein
VAIFILPQVKITPQERGTISVLGSKMDGLNAAVLPKKICGDSPSAEGGTEMIVFLWYN